ncbi:MAG TPA: hypothetical protein VNB49_01255 [Candidatus Dormibacteraeota bacterium]|nr:hypothetical protein [Candidatus Dormibacteraeota bacterium]
MNRRSQISSTIHSHHYFIGAWIFVSIRFSKRLLLLDERSDDFLKTLVFLGGYCTIEQAQKLGLANSARRVVARLEALKQNGFLKQVAHYPVIYQVTGSATRLVGSDLMARRQRTLLTIRCKLLGVNFYLEAKAWPADFVLDHAKKIALLNGIGCPTEALPHIGGQPYHWQEFVLRRPDGTICVAAVDRGHDTAKYQTRTLAQRYASVLEHLPSQFRLIVAVASNRREELYRKWAAQPIARPFTHDTLQLYRVKALLPQIQISHEEKMG